MKRLFFLAGVLCIAMAVSGQLVLSAMSYTQDFNSLSNVSGTSTMPIGWQFGETGTGANSFYAAGTGSASTGDTYSFGPASSTERALGGLRSASLLPFFGFYFINNTGNTIISLSISYKGETWRVGTVNRSDRLRFQYSSTAMNVTSGSWLDHTQLDYTNPGQATTGNGNVQDSAIISSSITGLSISNGASFFIRWMDFDAIGSDDGMGIDDLTMNVTLAIPAPVSLFDFEGKRQNKSNLLIWKTLTESNNNGFEIQGSENGSDFIPIGFVSSKATGGNSIIEVSYSFADETPVNRRYYRLKQLDFDNRYSFSNTVFIMPAKPLSIIISNLFPNPAHNRINVTVESYKHDKISLVVTDISGKIVKQTNAVITGGSNTLHIDINQLVKGNYYLRIINDSNEMITRKFVVL